MRVFPVRWHYKIAWFMTGEPLRRWYFHRIQRMQRGWSFIDAWSFDSHLTRVIIGGCKHLRDNYGGYPSALPSQEAWAKILSDIITGFEAQEKLAWFEYDTEDEAVRADLEVKSELGWKLLKEWYGALWS